MKKLIRTQYRRKREGKTDYKKRLKLLSSNIPRIVIRTSLKNIIVQLAEYHHEGDKILVSSSTLELKKNYKWPSRRNIPSAYLSGLLFGVKLKSKNITKAILDVGPFVPIKCSVKYAILKGILDAGINVPHSEEVLPSDDRIAGKHIADYAKKAKDKFSLYTKEGIKPEELSKLFENTKNELLKGVRNDSKKEKTA